MEHFCTSEKYDLKQEKNITQRCVCRIWSKYSNVNECKFNAR